jgi:hypothetical protein
MSQLVRADVACHWHQYTLTLHPSLQHNQTQLPLTFMTITGNTQGITAITSVLYCAVL